MSAVHTGAGVRGAGRRLRILTPSTLPTMLLASIVAAEALWLAGIGLVVWLVIH